jgi:pimeloyl-ACP methyl ester carboxylesterase
MSGWRGNRRLVLATSALISLLFLGACDPELMFTPVPPTETPVILPASPTVDPVLPTLPEGFEAEDPLATRVAGFQPRVLTLAPNTSFTATPLPPPTETFIRLQFTMLDGVSLESLLFGAPRRPAPTVLLLHDADATKEALFNTARTLQTAGLNVVVLDQRGFGSSGGTRDWSRAAQDVVSVLERLHSLPNLDQNRLYVLGVGAGANLALTGCANTNLCQAAVLISPLPALNGAALESALPAYGGRPLLLAYGSADAQSAAAAAALETNFRGVRRSLPYESAARGMILLDSEPNLSEIIARWLLE